ncbi:alpha-(1,3)-fucosyltransferase C-like isoform X2 [Haliotis asinina]
MKTVHIKRKFRVLLLICSFTLLLLLLLLSWSGCPSGGCVRHTGPYIRQLPHREWRNTTHKTILRWTGFFGDMSWEQSDDRYFQRCKVKTCKLTQDKDKVGEADALLFHAGSTFNFWRGITWPTVRLPHQVWIMYNVEPPPRTPLNFQNLAGLFNWTAWYRFDSDVPVTYGGLVKYDSDMLNKYSKTSRNFSAERPRLAGWMSSNCYDYSRRLVVINKIKHHLPLETYGKCGVRRCPETICRDTISVYKFFFAIENCLCKDYVSEKFWEALRRQQVPVVLGGADYQKFAPPHSFINIADFPDMKSLGDYLLKLEKDEQAYNKYLEWTKSYDVYGELEARRLFWCDLCEALHDKSRPAQVYDNLDGWVNDEPESCPQWTLGNQLGRWLDGLKIKWSLM